MLIGLGYKKRSGKDTVGTMLSNMYGFQILSFAQPLKELCSLMVEKYKGSRTFTEYAAQVSAWADRYGLHKKHYIYDKILNMDIPSEWFVPDESGKYRELLQKVGTEVIRNSYSPTFWIGALTLQMSKYKDCVITDVRFPNEKDFVEGRGYAVLVDRDTGLQDTHCSEKALDGAEWSYIIDNNGDKGMLREQVSDLYGELLIAERN